MDGFSVSFNRTMPDGSVKPIVRVIAECSALVTDTQMDRIQDMMAMIADTLSAVLSE